MKDYIFKHNIYILKRQNDALYNSIIKLMDINYVMSLSKDNKYEKLIEIIEKKILYMDKIHTQNILFISYLDKLQIHENIFIYMIDKLCYYITGK